MSRRRFWWVTPLWIWVCWSRSLWDCWVQGQEAALGQDLPVGWADVPPEYSRSASEHPPSLSESWEAAWVFASPSWEMITLSGSQKMLWPWASAVAVITEPVCHSGWMESSCPIIPWLHIHSVCVGSALFTLEWNKTIHPTSLESTSSKAGLLQAWTEPPAFGFDKRAKSFSKPYRFAMQTNLMLSFGQEICKECPFSWNLSPSASQQTQELQSRLKRTIIATQSSAEIMDRSLWCLFLSHLY